jgi:hypothetical protein
MASSEVSINQLPVVNSVNNGDFLIIQTPNATNRLDFENFVIGLDNVTFSNTIEQHTTDITALSGVLYGTPAAIGNAYTTDDISGLPINIAGTNYNILLSAAI